MAVAQGPFLAAVLLLVSSGLHCSSSLPACPESCSCQRAPLLNCSSSGLSLAPRHIQDSVTELDLSHNLLDCVTLDRPYHNLRNVWLGNNSITRLSLCIERNHHVRGRHVHRLRPWGRRGCVSWAPTLYLLSVERNQLEQLPEGLEGSESLQVLQLSFNKISTLQPGDLSHLRQLKELHLQHNLVTSLHPQMFQNLDQLRVLDLSFNMLTSLHPLMYLSLRNIGADVRLSGNRWQCDCSMHSLKRRMAYDRSRGLQAWSVVCASPSILSGKDLLQLEEDDLNCFSTENRPELHQDVTVYSGSEILLSCTTQDSVWWTPSGQASVSQPQVGLLINDITERDTGLYVCVSEEHKVVSVFNLQISKIGGARRKTRSLPQGNPNRLGQERNQRATQSNLALAVCLSVFITFLIAFILGVLARPCIDVLWRRVTNKKSSSATNSVSSAEQRQYDNEAYSNGEEPEEIGTHRERRVTFSTVDFREDSNVQYYDTVASDDQESINNDAEIECEEPEAERDTLTAGDSGSENSLQQTSPDDNQKDGTDLSGVTDAGCTHNIEFEHIPDPVEMEKRRSLSSCSDSSVSDKVFKDQMTQGGTTLKSPQLTEDSIQQRADFSAARKVEVPGEIPEYSSGPFADWSPNTNNADLWRESEEQFEFSDSVRSTSARSSGVFGSFNDSKLIVAPTSDKQRRDDMSSSSSYISGDEPTQYTVNSDQEEEEEEDIQRNHNKPEGEWDTKEKVKPMPWTKWRVPTLDVTNHSKSLDTGAPSPPAAYSSSSSSESEAEISDLKVEHNKNRVNEGIKVNEPETLATDLDHQRIPQIRRRFDINAPLPASDSSSSDESTDETTKHTKKQEQGDVDMAGLQMKKYQFVSHDAMKPQLPALDLGHVIPIKRRLDIRAPSPPTDSSSSSDCEDETTGHTEKQRPGMVDFVELPLKKSTDSHYPDTRWPTLDLEHTTHIKRRLDIKTPSMGSDSSSSSDSEDETTHHTERPGKVDIAGLPFKESQTVSHDPETRWPALDLTHTMHIKRRLDVKAPSPPPDSSSSSDSEDETTGHKEKQRPGKVDIAGLPFQESQAQSHDPDTRWPVLDLEHIPRIKRRLDIEAPSPPPDSSSRSDSEDETTNHIKTQEQGQMYMARLPIKVSKTVTHDPQTHWPALDLEHTTRIKRCLDIKTLSLTSDSSSSSDSEDETTHHTERPGKVDIAKLPLQESQTVSHDPDARWPALDLEHIPRTKRHLNIKAPSPPPASFSNHEIVEEKIAQIKRHEQGEVHVPRIPFQESQTGSHDPETQWSALDLEHTMRIKRRLDIKAPSPPPDSSSSSDSEDETTGHTERPGKVVIAGLPLQESQTVSHDPDARWPALDLEHIPRTKRCLDIKAPSMGSDSSSSSDSDDASSGHTEKQRPGKVDIAEVPLQESQTVSHDPDARWPALDLEHIPCIKRRLNIKAPSPPPDSFSNSEIVEEKIAQIQKHEQGGLHVPRLPFQESQAGSHDPDTRWPALDLEHIPRIKRHLDIKGPSPPPDSSSDSDSEDGITNHIKKQEQGETHIARLPIKVSQTVNHDPKTQWPALDLEHTTRIKRRLDIKAPSMGSDSSSSSDSDDASSGHTEKQRPGKVDIAEVPFKKSHTQSHDPQTQWPTLDLEHATRIKRRLDIKGPSPDSSSSSDSEDETTNHIKKQEQGETHIARLPIKVSQTVNHDPKTQWPALDLEHTTRIKRRLDIKAPSMGSDSSSSSDSEDASSGHTEKQRPGKVDIAEVPFKKSHTQSHDPQTQWPTLDFEHATRIKRRLDIKGPSPDSSSSSDSEDETTNHIKKQEQGETHIARLPIKVSQTVNHDPKTQWPALDLEHTTRIKRRLDIKAPSPDSSSSSDSEDASSGHTGKVVIAEVPFQKSHTESHDPETRWPTLDLEHTTRIKRRLDIKAPSPDSSSSSNSEDEITTHIRKQGQGETDMARLPIAISQTLSHDQETPWPALDLEHTTRIKRRLDIKPASDSSSRSDSEDETIQQHTKNERPGVVGIAGLPFKESETVSHDPETRWPAIDLDNITRIKRRLDLKAPSPAPGLLLSGGSTNHAVEGERKEAIKMSPCYSSRSSDEQEGGLEDLSNLPTTVEPDPDSRWPELDLSSAPHVKRRLDIKARSLPPSEGGTTDLPVNVERKRTDVGTSHQPGTKLPDLNMSVPPVKQRLNIKAPSQSADSCSFNSDNESRLSSHTVKHQTDKGDTGITNHEQQTKLHKLSLGVPYINRRLDIKAPSPQPDLVLSSVSPGSQQSESNSFRNDSEDENGDHTELGLGVSVISKVTEKVRSPKTPVINISHSPKTDHNIKLEKYTVITDDMGNKTTNDNISTTPEINPELESRWATMNLGISRFRKRLEITSYIHDPPNLPSSPPPDQNHTSLYVAQAVSLKLDQSQSQTEGVELKRQTKVGEESDSMRPHMSLTNIPHIKRALDIRAPLQREASSSSNSENETIDHSVRDLSLGVPQVKRCLNVKAPLPEPSNSPSSCNESENEVTNMSGMTDNDSLITYKRLIMKTLPPPSNSFSPSGQTIHHTNQRHTGADTVTVAQEGPSPSVGDKNASLAPRRVPSMSFDVVKKRIKQSRCSTDVDLPPEIRWTGVGRQLTDLSISSPRSHLDVGLSSPQQAPPAEPELPPPDSFNSSSGKSCKIKQDRGKADVTLMQYSSVSASSVSLASSRALDKFDNSPSITNEILRAVSEDRMERKGLSALKVMSSERQKWDTEDENVDKGASSLFDDYGSQGDTRSEEDIKPLAKQPLTQIHLSSTSVNERRAADLLYGIPRYRRHDIGDIKPLQEAPPPIPATPPLHEAVGLTWRSPQSSKKQGLEGTRSYLQQSRNTEETDPSSLTSQYLAVYFDSSNMNISDV